MITAGALDSTSVRRYYKSASDTQVREPPVQDSGLEVIQKQLQEILQHQEQMAVDIKEIRITLEMLVTASNHDSPPR